MTSATNPPRRVPPPYAEFAGDKQFATTLARGLWLLNCFTPQEPLLGNRELADRSGLPKATVSRLTYTLAQAGFLRLHRKLQKYQVAPAVLSLAYPLIGAMTWRQIARPLMNELADHARGSVSLSVRDRLRMVYVETSRNTSTFFAQVSDIGFSLPLLASVSGRAYLVGCGEREREHLLNELHLRQPEIWEQYHPKLEPAFAEYRRKGFCVSRGDLRKDLHAVSTPLARPWHDEVIVVTCAVQSHLGRGNVLENDLGPRLVALARQLEVALGQADSR